MVGNFLPVAMNDWRDLGVARVSIGALEALFEIQDFVDGGGNVFLHTLGKLADSNG